MHTVLTDALLGTKVVTVEDVGTHRDSAMVASWVGNTTREENFLTPGVRGEGQVASQGELRCGCTP
jgi:hypothetical protein